MNSKISYQLIKLHQALDIFEDLHQDILSCGVILCSDGDELLLSYDISHTSPDDVIMIRIETDRNIFERIKTNLSGNPKPTNDSPIMVSRAVSSEFNSDNTTVQDLVNSLIIPDFSIMQQPLIPDLIQNVAMTHSPTLSDRSFNGLNILTSISPPIPDTLHYPINTIQPVRLIEDEASESDSESLENEDVVTKITDADKFINIAVDWVEKRQLVMPNTLYTLNPNAKRPYVYLPKVINMLIDGDSKWAEWINPEKFDLLIETINQQAKITYFQGSMKIKIKNIKLSAKNIRLMEWNQEYLGASKDFAFL